MHNASHLKLRSPKDLENSSPAIGDIFTSIKGDFAREPPVRTNSQTHIPAPIRVGAGAAAGLRNQYHVRRLIYRCLEFILMFIPGFWMDGSRWYMLKSHATLQVRLPHDYHPCVDP